MFGTVDQTATERLEREGFRVRMRARSRRLREPGVLRLAHDAVGVIAGVEAWTERLMRACPRLRVISRIGVGIDQIDVRAAERLGIAVRTTPEPIAQPVAEMVLAMALSLLKRLPGSPQRMASGIWRAAPGGLLAGRTLGIIGLGRIGRRLVEVVASWGVQVLAHDVAPDAAFARRHGVRLVALEDLLKEADIVTLHLPYTPGTEHLMNEAQFRLMKRGALFINTARGKLVDEPALLRALREGRLAGAGLDVFETEPYSGTLCRLPNVITTPHVASFTTESWREMERLAVENLLDELGASQ
jgi:D-3-phosphoglycerate dehydrogenase